MFNQQDILHFRTFGYVVARKLFSAGKVATLQAEVSAALVDAFGGVGTDANPDGTGEGDPR